MAGFCARDAKGLVLFAGPVSLAERKNRSEASPAQPARAPKKIYWITIPLRSSSSPWLSIAKQEDQNSLFVKMLNFS